MRVLQNTSREQRTLFRRFLVLLGVICLGFTAQVSAQRDLLVTQAGEEIRCRILDETPTRFIYAYVSKGDKVLRNEIFKNLVTSFKYNYYDTDLVKSDKLPGNSKREGGKAERVDTRKSNSSSSKKSRKQRRRENASEELNEEVENALVEKTDSKRRKSVKEGSKETAIGDDKPKVESPSDILLISPELAREISKVEPDDSKSKKQVKTESPLKEEKVISPAPGDEAKATGSLIASTSKSKEEKVKEAVTVREPEVVNETGAKKSAVTTSKIKEEQVKEAVPVREPVAVNETEIKSPVAQSKSKIEEETASSKAKPKKESRKEAKKNAADVESPSELNLDSNKETSKNELSKKEIRKIEKEEKKIAKAEALPFENAELLAAPEKENEFKNYLKFRVGVRGGLSNVINNTLVTTNAYDLYREKLNKGWTFGTDAAYFITEGIGIGAMFSNFMSSNSADRLTYPNLVNQVNVDNGSIATNISNKYVGPVLYFRKGIDFKTFVVLGLSPGMNFYNEKGNYNGDNFDFKARQFGGAATLGLDFLLGNDIIGRDIILSLEAGYNYSRFNELDYGSIRGMETLASPLIMDRLDFSIGLRFMRFPKYLKLSSY